MFSIKYYIKHPETISNILLYHLGYWLPDKTYLKLKFRLRTGQTLNLNNPQTFSEKLQWLKLYDRRPEYVTMVDKIAVKDYVAKIIGEEYIIPTLGVWDRPEDIDWDMLPNQFVLKCSHDSGGLVICKNKAKLNKSLAIKKINKSLRTDYYKKGREWPYKNVPRRILAEKYIHPAPDMNDLPDYKFFCFDGEPKYCQVISGRGSKMCIDFFDEAWEHQPFHEPKSYPFAESIPEKPLLYDEMWRLAQVLAKNKSFSRIDFYNVNGKIYFGEITFFPTSGMGGFAPQEWDYKFGEYIHLPTNKK